VLFSQNATLPLAPASNEKLAVAYTALAVLGSTFHIPTYVLGEGELVGDTWDGDVLLQGHGDPTLSSAGLKRLARQLRDRGIREISGNVVGDESWFDTARTGAGWKPSFYLDESPPLSALAVDGDRFHGVLSRTPALSATMRFTEILKAAGITVDGTSVVHRASPNAVTLAGIASVPLQRIVRRMDLQSDNFVAELLLKQLGATQLDRGTSAAGGRIILKTLAENDIPTTGVRIVDGSGLSSLDRLTAQTLVGILESAWASPTLRGPLVQSLPVAGVSGTLDDRMRSGPARGRVQAKTGTTSLASALSGYAKARYVFAVLQNGRPIPYWWARVAQDRFAQLLAAQ
jgi:D-alanyl-D-alanine carboxypeptidase/D-alanyl-D-alanine-endopeptidase (penicillin-binding protein 4)